MGKFYYGDYNTKYIVCVDDGHGLETAGKRTPDGYKENEFNHAVKLLLFEALKRCGVGCYDVSPDRTDNRLSDRTDSANSLIKTKEDAKRVIYVSIHYDALSDIWSDANGLSVYYYPGTSDKLARCIHNFLVQGTKQQDRGVLTADFHVLRETVMPAVLTENGFMSNRFEASLMKNPYFQKEVAEEHCKGICAYFGVTYTPENGKIYRVQVGAFATSCGADKLLIELKSKGYPGIVV